VYRRLVELAAQMTIPDLRQEDTEWATKQDEDNRRKLTRMEGELRGYKNNLIRESIRMGQEDLANHHLETGGPVPDPSNASSMATSGYNAAYQAFGKMRDYCTTPTHVNAMNLRLVYTAFLQAVHVQAMGNSGATHFNAVLINANRLKTSGVKEEEEAKLLPIVHVAAGIASLSTGEYRSAALSFMSAPFDYHNLGESC
jgi:COP9 signalosome complex subunit 1